MHIPKDLVAASAAPLILSMLAHGESYGYAIIRGVHELSDGEIEWTDGFLYPVLHRLEQTGAVETRWAASEAGRRRRYYRITDAGLAALAEHRQQWSVMVDALQRAWSGLQLADSADETDGRARLGPVTAAATAATLAGDRP